MDFKFLGFGMRHGLFPGLLPGGGQIPGLPGSEDLLNHWRNSMPNNAHQVRLIICLFLELQHNKVTKRVRLKIC